MRRVAIVGVAFVAAMLSGGCNGMKVEPGQVGILVNYSNSEVKEIKPGTFWWNFNAFERLITYPVTQQTMVMTKNEFEGKNPVDDSTPCRDKLNNPVAWDVALTWRVDPSHAADLYYLKREMPLVDTNSQSDIEDTVVRQVARSRLREVCPLYDYAEMERQRLAISEAYANLLRGDLTASFLILDEVFLRDLHLSEQQQGAINAQVAAAQALVQKENERQQAVKTAETAKVNYEAEQSKATYENDQNNLRRVAQAKAEAEAVLAKAAAEAEGNERLSRSVTPALTDYVKAQRWNGQVPTTVLSPGQQTLVQVP